MLNSPKAMFLKQLELINQRDFENEFQTIGDLHNMPADIKEMLHQQRLEWLRNMPIIIQHNTDAETSDSLRQEGNNFFTGKDSNRDVLAACSLYTQSIIAAPLSGETVALAYANRAMTLQEYGYFQQAYDDCVCALEHGYPPRLLQKIKSRQAYCAWKLGDAPLLKLHLEEFEKLPLNEVFKQQANVFRSGLDELLSKNKPATPNADDNEFPMHRETQKIVDSKGPKGKYMVATKLIKENEGIFTDYASSFVPLEKIVICSHCAATHFIPIMCLLCRIAYCSLKCRNAHTNIHMYECPGYQKNIFNQLGIRHLPLRVVIEELPQLIPLLRDQPNAEALWNELVVEGSIAKSDTIKYSHILRMCTNICKKDKRTVGFFALTAELLVAYLTEETTFFNLFEDTTAGRSDWQMITAALIMRHIGQFSCNATTVRSVTHYNVATYSELDPYPLLFPETWSSPFHLKRGLLHKLRYFMPTAVGLFPYLSNCNHQCEPGFKTNISGRYLRTIATKDIQEGDEIATCHTPDFRYSMLKERHEHLKEHLDFVCDCAKCNRENPDQDYEKYHRYVCENPKCGKVFVPVLPNKSDLIWWTFETEPLEQINCSICGTMQRFPWLKEINNLIKAPYATTTRRLLFKKLAELDNYLMDYNELKLIFNSQVVSDCFDAYKSGSFFSDKDFVKLVNALKFVLRGVADRNGTTSLRYICRMTFLWDLIALGKYKCSSEEMQTMLDALEIASDEIKLIFLNYYKDYIANILVK